MNRVSEERGDGFGRGQGRGSKDGLLEDADDVTDGKVDVERV